MTFDSWEDPMDPTPMPRPLRWMALCLAAYVGVLTIARIALPDTPTLVEAAPYAVVAAALGVAVLLLGALDARRRRDDVDRHVLVEATSLAFFVTMAVAVTWGMFESFADAPPPSAWATWSVGMGTWLVASLVARRRLA